MKTRIEPGLVARAAEAAGFGAALSRRQFLLLSAGAVTGLAALNAGCAWGDKAPVVIIDNARGLILADPTRCVGCQRCELACTEFNDGVSQPAMARIKVGRNINFGPEGPSAGVLRVQGAWGNRFVHSGYVQAVPPSCALCHGLSGKRHKGRPDDRRPVRGHGLMHWLSLASAGLPMERYQL